MKRENTMLAFAFIAQTTTVAAQQVTDFPIESTSLSVNTSAEHLFIEFESEFQKQIQDFKQQIQQDIRTQAEQSVKAFSLNQVN